jgi:3-hydroxyacyl-[acyl-carrier-protein] dehydratase
MQPGQMKLPISLFSLADGVEFRSIVSPGERVIIKGKKIYFRRNTIKSSVSMERENGEIICLGELSGVGVDR